MRNLCQNTHAISCLSFCIFSGSVLKLFYNTQGSCHCTMCLFAFDIDNCTNTTVIMFKTFTIQTLLWDFIFFPHSRCPFFCIFKTFLKYNSFSLSCKQEFSVNYLIIRLFIILFFIVWLFKFFMNLTSIPDIFDISFNHWIFLHKSKKIRNRSHAPLRTIQDCIFINTIFYIMFLL